MNNDRKFLLYMDLLGTKEIVNGGSYELLKKLVQQFTSNCKQFKIDYKEVLNDPNIRHKIDKIDPEISNFSDHFIASYPSYYSQPPFDTKAISCHIFFTSLINIASQFHIQGLTKSILMRGAITEGTLFHSGNSVIGYALIEAVELEEKSAIYPRVIVPDKIIKLISDHGLEIKYMHIKRDFDGIYYVDYLKNNLFLGHGESLIKSFKKLKQIIKKQVGRY